MFCYYWPVHMNVRNLQVKRINGFSNEFYGWGGEDDDILHRIEDANITVFRQPANIARFTMLLHGKVCQSTKSSIGCIFLSLYNPQRIQYMLILIMFICFQETANKDLTQMMEKSKEGKHFSEDGLNSLRYCIYIYCKMHFTQTKQNRNN